MVSKPRADLPDLPPPILPVQIPRAPLRAVFRASDDGEAPPDASELETQILQMVGAGSAAGRWESETAIYMRTIGERRCPHGHVHYSDNYMINLRGQEVWSTCCFTPECAAPKSIMVGVLPYAWSVPRTRCTCRRLVDGVPRPCVREIVFQAGQRCIVETTEMGGGKTEQTVRLIERMPANEPVLYVVHRVMLADSIVRRLQALGFVL